MNADRLFANEIFDLITAGFAKEKIIPIPAYDDATQDSKTSTAMRQSDGGTHNFWWSVRHDDRPEGASKVIMKIAKRDGYELMLTCNTTTGKLLFEGVRLTGGDAPSNVQIEDSCIPENIDAAVKAFVSFHEMAISEIGRRDVEAEAPVPVG